MDWNTYRSVGYQIVMRNLDRGIDMEIDDTRHDYNSYTSLDVLQVLINNINPFNVTLREINEIIYRLSSDIRFSMYLKNYIFKYNGVYHYSKELKLDLDSLEMGNLISGPSLRSSYYTKEPKLKDICKLYLEKLFTEKELKDIKEMAVVFTKHQNLKYTADYLMYNVIMKDPNYDFLVSFLKRYSDLKTIIAAEDGTNFSLVLSKEEFDNAKITNIKGEGVFYVANMENFKIPEPNIILKINGYTSSFKINLVLKER